MGIRFLCPNGHKLNVKADLAGKRASCPECGAKLVIPLTEAEAAAQPAPAVSVGSTPTSTAWFLRTSDGEQRGPATEDQFRTWISVGDVKADAYVWREGWPEWKLARDAADTLPMPLVAEPVAVALATPALGLPISAEPAISIPEPVIDLAAIVPLVSETAVGEPGAVSSSSYVVQRQRGKKTQLTLAIAMLVAVIVLAGVLVWVLQNNVSSTPPTSRANTSSSISPSVSNC